MLWLWIYRLLDNLHFQVFLELHCSLLGWLYTSQLSGRCQRKFYRTLEQTFRMWTWKDRKTFSCGTSLLFSFAHFIFFKRVPLGPFCHLGNIKKDLKRKRKEGQPVCHLLWTVKRRQSSMSEIHFSWLTWTIFGATEKFSLCGNSSERDWHELEISGSSWWIQGCYKRQINGPWRRRMCFRGTIISESWNIQPIFTHPSLSIVSVVWYLRISVAAFD